MATQPKWTPSQQAAIEHVAGDMLVSAAAGSGKTAVLAQRCARLVCDVPESQGGCGVENLLVLTFTDAAAGEMRTRIAQAIRGKLKTASASQLPRLHRQAAMVDRASISTLHAFCARVLRQHFEQVPSSAGAPGIDPAFEVIDEDDARLLREDVLADLFARWHKTPPTPDFPDFFDAYAQGRESTLREIILRVHNMLESTADPDAYLAAARHRYSPSGCVDTLGHYARVTLANELRLMSLAATRACAAVESAAGPGPMLTGLQHAAQLLAWSMAELQQKSVDALQGIKSALDFKWPTLRRPKDFEETAFEKLKKSTWESLKTSLAKFSNVTLCIPADQLQSDLASLAGPLSTLLALVAQFRTAYTAGKRNANRLDFADLERLTLNLLTAPNGGGGEGSSAADELRRRYKHLLVDEFQDINPLQAALLHAVRSPEAFDKNGNLFVVGDIKQSIYGFRLADPNLFFELEKFAKAANTPTRQQYINLPNNFRSDPRLLTAMNALFEKILTDKIAGVTYNEGHALEPAPNTATPLVPRPSGSAPQPQPETDRPLTELHLVAMDQQNSDEENETDDPSDADSSQEGPSAIEEEARMVADRIAALIAEKRPITLKDGATRPIEYRDIAILLRSMKHKALPFTRALARQGGSTGKGIPVHADLSTGYFDAPEIAYTLNLLRVLDNPRQDIPLTSALLSPYAASADAPHFTHDDLALIRLTYDKKTKTGIPFHEAVARYAKSNRTNLAQDAPDHDATLARRLAAFLSKLERWRAKLLTRPLHEGLAAIFSDARIFPYLAGLDAGGGGQQCIANLQALHQRALKFSTSTSAAGKRQGLHRFLRFIENLLEQDNADYGEAPVLSEASNVVRIMSIHKSKGLEFPVVFVSGLGGKFNLSDAAGGAVNVHRNEGIALQVADPTRNIFYPSALTHIAAESSKRTLRAEELRLLYVALTRARNCLILTGHIDKEERLDTARFLWNDLKGPLPEDILLRATSSLHWLLPALAAANLRIQWPGTPIENPDLVITTHAPIGAVPDAASAPAAAQDLLAQKLQNAQPLPITTTDHPDFDRLFTRITGEYAHQSLATQAAVLSVTQLKKQAALKTVTDDEFLPTPLLAVAAAATLPLTTSTDPIARGIATHRILELLDFTCTPDALDAHIQHLLNTGRLDPEQAKSADRPGIAWFLTTPIADRIRAAALDKAFTLRREIPFTCLATPTSNSPFTISNSPLDLPTIRGIIDLLLVNRSAKTAEIIDYKTDSLATWQQNLPAYRDQMRYYLRAASQILTFPVTRATLLFLTPKHSEEVLHQNP